VANLNGERSGILGEANALGRNLRHDVSARLEPEKSRPSWTKGLVTTVQTLPYANQVASPGGIKLEGKKKKYKRRGGRKEPLADCALSAGVGLPKNRFAE